VHPVDVEDGRARDLPDAAERVVGEADVAGRRGRRLEQVLAGIDVAVAARRVGGEVALRVVARRAPADAAAATPRVNAEPELVPLSPSFLV
jgi:hypothetical protein